MKDIDIAKTIYCIYFKVNNFIQVMHLWGLGIYVVRQVARSLCLKFIVIQIFKEFKEQLKFYGEISDDKDP